MSTIERFEDIQAWQEARVLTKLVYGLTSDGKWAKDYGLKDQVRRACVSIMSNIAECFERRGTAEFHRFLAIAKGSAAEVKSQMYVALDMDYIGEKPFTTAYQLADKAARLIGGLMNYLKMYQAKK